MIRLLVLSLFLWFPVIASGATCDAPENENFLTFFFRFSGDKDFSVSRTLYPLKVLAQQYGIDQLGNNVSSTKRLTRTKKQDGELPGLSSLLQMGNLIAKVHQLSSKSSVVQVYGESSEWAQTYHFSRRGRCWYLKEFREHSVSNKHWVEHQELAPRSEFVPHFYIKQDNQALRNMLRVLNHLAFVRDGLTLGETEDAQIDLLNLCEAVEANTDYAIEEREQVAVELREALSLFNRGADAEGSAILINISRKLWSKIN